MITHNQAWRQEEHDRLFHADIYTLDRHRRLAHLVLHMAKYNGKLLQAKSNKEVCEVAIDAMIVLTSIFNTIGRVIEKVPLNPAYETHNIETLVVEVGKMCKVIESIDHFEYIDIRTNLAVQSGILMQQWHDVWIAHRSNDLCEIYPYMLERLIAVEQKNIHYEFIVAENKHIHKDVPY